MGLLLIGFQIVSSGVRPLLVGFRKGDSVADGLAFRGSVTEAEQWSKLDWARSQVSSGS